MRIETITGTAPACWASYLVNGDASGIDEDDIKQADQFVTFMTEGYEDEPGFLDCYGPTDVQECGFMRSTDGCDLGCDAAEYTFVIRYNDEVK